MNAHIPSGSARFLEEFGGDERTGNAKTFAIDR